MLFIRIACQQIRVGEKRVIFLSAVPFPRNNFNSTFFYSRSTFYLSPTLIDKLPK